MSDFNSVIFSGLLVKAPEVVIGDDALVRFTFAMVQNYTNKAGDDAELVFYVYPMAKGKHARALASRVEVGKLYVVYGFIRHERDPSGFQRPGIGISDIRPLRPGHLTLESLKKTNARKAAESRAQPLPPDYDKDSKWKLQPPPF